MKKNANRFWVEDFAILNERNTRSARQLENDSTGLFSQNSVWGYTHKTTL
jgi:hypothetical protein